MAKLYKIIASIVLASTFTISLVSCQNNNFKDSDFDGLADNIDPDPNNNQYQISLVNKTDEEVEETGQLTLTMDYRDFLSTGYKYNLGILGSFLVNAINTSYQPKVHNNVYPKIPTVESVLSPLLAQIGAKNIEMIKVSGGTFDNDPYDIVDAMMANHVFMNEGKKYQVYFVVIDPYPFRTGWVSNFDVGATKEDGTFTESYIELEGNNHPDWLESNHLDHKGFSVTTTRLLKGIKIYQEMYREVNATPITYITGHSRGGSVANLVGKDFIDNNQDIRAYCFNPANTTIVDDNLAKKEAYNASIFNIINNGDLVSRIPSFGFKLYGKDISNNINNDKYKEFMKKDYEGNTPEAVSKVEGLLNKIVTKGGTTSRNNFYEFRDIDEEYPERWEGTLEEMNNLKDELDNGYFMPNDSYTRKCFTYGDVKEDTEEETFYIEYQTKPALLKALLVDILDKKDFTYLISYLELLDRLITEALELYVISDFSAIGVKNGHEQPIACVMASQIQE